MTDSNKNSKLKNFFKTESETEEMHIPVKTEKESNDHQSISPLHQIFFAENHFDEKLDIKEERDVIECSQDTDIDKLKHEVVVNNKNKTEWSNNEGVVSLEKEISLYHKNKSKNYTVCEEGGVIVLPNSKKTKNLVDYSSLQQLWLGKVNPSRSQSTDASNDSDYCRMSPDKREKPYMEQIKPLTIPTAQQENQTKCQEVRVEYEKLISPQKFKTSKPQIKHLRKHKEQQNPLKLPLMTPDERKKMLNENLCFLDAQDTKRE